MKYFIIAGEASGDLHASHLISALRRVDSDAQFRFLGGDLMADAAAVAPIVHYRDMAYMGFIEVAKHLPTILGFMRTAKREIASWKPDVVIPVDYPSFNLKVAKYAHSLGIPVHYFISPKVWVWKKWRVRDIKRYVSAMYCILPFEPEFYRAYDYEATYVGNPTVSEIAQAMRTFDTREDFAAACGMDPSRPIIAIVPGSRVKEINDNLPLMLQAATRHSDCQVAVAAAPSVEQSVYDNAMANAGITAPVLHDCTMQLVHHARVALVTSGTATLETALLGTPQVACYRMDGSKLVYWFYSKLLSGKYVTLPNLIADAPVIPELLMHLCTTDSIDTHLSALLGDSPERRAQLDGYARVKARLTDADAPARAAQLIVDSLNAKNV